MESENLLDQILRRTLVVNRIIKELEAGNLENALCAGNTFTRLFKFDKTQDNILFETYLKYGARYLRNQDYEAAKQCYQKALELDQSNEKIAKLVSKLG